MTRAGLVLLGALVIEGCVLFRPEVQPPPGTKLVVGYQIPSTARQWRCEGGEHVGLVSMDGREALVVESQDLAILDSASDADGVHWFARTLYDTVPVDGSVVRMASDYVVPQQVDGDLRVDRYEDVGPPVRFPDRSKSTAGTPLSREVCWSEKGPLAAAAKAASVHPADLLYIGAKRREAPSPPNSVRLAIQTCVGTGKVLPARAPLRRILDFVPGAPGAATLIVRTFSGRALELTELSADAHGCLMPGDGSTCLRADKAQAAGESFFYFERGDAGIRINVNAKTKQALLVFYAPEQLRVQGLPPTKNALAWPKSDEKSAFGCVLGAAS